MELGLHIADFTWTTGPARLGPELAAHAREAEAAGIARITVMDHFWQLPQIGPVEHEMLEAYTALGFIAAHTSKVKLHTLVTGVIYREPALLVKAVTTLDVLSEGRAGLGIGAAWNEQESEGLGFAFPPTGERMDRLEEAVRITRQMWSDSEEPFEGKYYRLGRTLNSPQPVSKQPYLMIGGGGEKRTLRLVAQYADACNFSFASDPAHKLEVLRGHCDAVGRDYETIEKTVMVVLTPDKSKDALVAELAGFRDQGFTAGYVFTVGMAERHQIIDVVGAAASELA